MSVGRLDHGEPEPGPLVEEVVPVGGRRELAVQPLDVGVGGEARRVGTLLGLELRAVVAGHEWTSLGRSALRPSARSRARSTSGKAPIAGTDDRGGERPFHGDGRVVPPDSHRGAGVVGGGDQVLHLGVVLQGQVPVRDALGDRDRVAAARSRA